MPNQQGGKNYKKSKHSTGETAKLQEADVSEGQLYGRILKVLGNRNFQVYGNDGRTRICKVCGAMTKRVWLAVGDLIIFSLRDFEVSAKVKGEDRLKQADRGDIIYKFDQSLLGKAKKLAGINQNLFLQLETADGKTLGVLGERGADLDVDDVLEFERSDDDEKEEEDGEEGGVSAAGKKGKAKESKHAAAGAGDNDDFDIDDI